MKVVCCQSSMVTGFLAPVNWQPTINKEMGIMANGIVKWFDEKKDSVLLIKKKAGTYLCIIQPSTCLDSGASIRATG